EPSRSAKPLPEERIGAEMRRARESKGISLRQMAKRLGYHSHTTLSTYERGAVMPTEEAVQNYERGLGLGPDTLLSILESARIERHGDAWPKRRLRLPPEFVQNNSGPESVGRKPGGRMRRVVQRWPIAGVGALVIAVAVVVVFVVLTGQHKPSKADTS